MDIFPVEYFPPPQWEDKHNNKIIKNLRVRK